MSDNLDRILRTQNPAMSASVTLFMCPDCNGRGCHYDSHWRAGGTAGVCHRCQSTGFVNQRIAAAEQETP